MTAGIHNLVKSRNFIVNCNIDGIIQHSCQLQLTTYQLQLTICFSSTNIFHVHLWHAASTTAFLNVLEAIGHGLLEELEVVTMSTSTIKPCGVHVKMSSRYWATGAQGHCAALLDGKLRHLDGSQAATNNQDILFFAKLLQARAQLVVRVEDEPFWDFCKCRGDSWESRYPEGKHHGATIHFSLVICLHNEVSILARYRSDF
mmetsp:Transcript_75991/g.134207  ORF Transcript_75991/g.134207 Transcript_75991/m.134207 type:complete len:202 (-) Transcript_75991:549-1154(-)